MKMRAQLLLSAVTTAMISGLVGMWLLSAVAARSEQTFLDDELQTSEQAVRRQLELRRSARGAAYQALARQPMLRGSVAARDYGQLSALAQSCRQAGADIVAIVDVASGLLAKEGAAEPLVLAASAKEISESATLIAVAGQVMDGWRIPIGSDPPVGYLIAANRIDREILQADAAPLGVASALAIGEVFATTLPPGMLTTSRWTELVSGARSLPEAERSKLQREYLLRAVPFGNGQLLVAVPQEHLQPFRRTLVGLSLGLVLVVLILTLAVVMWLVGRILSPIAKLTRAAELVGRGQLARSRPFVAEYAERRDEIGGLARAQLLATSRLHTVVKASQRLARHIDLNVDAVDTVAKTVAAGAARQEERLSDVTGTLEPLTRALVHTSQGLQDAQSLVTTLALSSSAADQTQAILAIAVRRAEALLNSKEKESGEPRALRTASVLQQSSVIAQAVADQREVFLKVRESVASLRSCIDAALESQLVEQHHGQHAHRATTEIGRLAKLHAQDATSLRAASERLRQDLSDLHKQLASLDGRTGDDSARVASSEERPSTGERASLEDSKRRDERIPTGERPGVDDPKRRPERARSTQSLSGPVRRSLPGTGISSNQSLIPVPGAPAPATSPATSSDRRAPGLLAANSGGGFTAISRSSGNFPKVSGPHDGVPSGASLRPTYASSLSNGGSLPGRSAGPGSGVSLNGSSGTLRPVAVGSGRSLGPSSGVSLNGSSGTLRPVAAGSGRSLGPASGASLNSSSGNLPPISLTPHGGLQRQPSAAPVGSEGGASARSLRPSGDPVLSASAQSLNHSLQGRRK